MTWHCWWPRKITMTHAPLTPASPLSCLSHSRRARCCTTWTRCSHTLPAALPGAAETVAAPIGGRPKRQTNELDGGETVAVPTPFGPRANLPRMTTPEPAPSRASELAALPLPASEPAPRLSQTFTAQTMPALRHAVRAYARRSGLTGDPLDDFVIAVHELIGNAVRHGGGRGRLHLRRDGDTLVCDVTDNGPGFATAVPAATAPPSPHTLGGRGLWLARQLTDTLLISDGPDGVTVSVTVCLPPAATPAPVSTAPVATEFAATEPGTPHPDRQAATGPDGPPAPRVADSEDGERRR
jgi:serine/threonine-protein kinase RsbW